MGRELIRAALAAAAAASLAAAAAPARAEPTYVVERCCDLCPQAANRAAYTTRFLQSFTTLLQGKDGWLFRTDDDLRTSFGPDAAGRLGDRTLLEPLRRLLSDANSAVRAAAAVSFGELAGVAGAETIAPLLKDESPDVRAGAVRVIGRLKALKYLPDVVDLLNDGAVSTWAMTALVAMDQRAAARHIVPFIKQDHLGTRWTALRCIARLQAVEVAEDVAPLLDDEDERIRPEALETLGAIGATQYAERFVALLDSPSFDIRLAAAAALHTVTTPPVTAKLAALLQTNGPGRAMAYYVLSEVEPGDLLTSMVERVKSGDTSAAQIVARWGTRDHLPLLLKTSPSAAAELAWRIGDSSAQEAAVALLRERERVPDKLEARAAAVAVLAFGGKSKAEQAALIEALPRDPSDFWEATDLLDALNRLHEPKSYAIMESRFELKKDVLTYADLVALFAERGLRLELDPDARRWVRLPAATRTSLRLALGKMWSGAVLSRHVINGTTVRMLPDLRTAREIWLERVRK